MNDFYGCEYFYEQMRIKDQIWFTGFDPSAIRAKKGVGSNLGKLDPTPFCGSDPFLHFSMLQNPSPLLLKKRIRPHFSVQNGSA
jgi:hypothetical protein